MLITLGILPTERTERIERNLLKLTRAWFFNNFFFAEKNFVFFYAFPAFHLFLLISLIYFFFFLIVWSLSSCPLLTSLRKCMNVFALITIESIILFLIIWSIILTFNSLRYIFFKAFYFVNKDFWLSFQRNAIPSYFIHFFFHSFHIFPEKNGKKCSCFAIRFHTNRITIWKF